ncbi:hypothetical protein L3X39_08020 [Sabulilitoribacter multivorans]|uniref:Lipoprotein n=1 Tax=Flaviramulus multivorans TaxID=1304750 RepID=A0ABS9IIJ3_9FLAO|nr:hypothetical protein [Flaviramulus multivorans]MCF7560581.1 hypothetical protein [Flaviramulus multivorans]
MNKILLRILVLFVLSLTSCTVKESIVFNEDGSGNFLLTYDMASAMEQMKVAMGGEDSTDSTEEKKSKVIDTMMVFSEIMETFKDSVAALPEDKRLALEAVKDMYMKMKMDEGTGVFDFGIGLNFKSISDLKGIQEKIEKAKSLNAQNDQVSAMKTGSPLGKFMLDEKNDVEYVFTDSSFSRKTSVSDAEEEITFEESDNEFIEYFNSAYYIVEYTFPKKIKSFSVEGAELSGDKKTITYKVRWLDFIKKPKILDFDVKFVNE